MFKIKRNIYSIQLTEHSGLEVEAYTKRGAAKLMWNRMPPNPTQCYPDGRGAFGSFNIFWKFAHKSYGIIKYGQVDD